MVDRLTALRQQASQGDASAQEQLGRELVSDAAVLSDEFAEGLDWTRQAADQGSITATNLLGHLHCQYPTLPDAPATAARAYEATARTGDPEALVRMADLYFFGYGVAQDDSKAFSILNQLCAASYPQVLCHAAYLHSRGMGCEVDEAEASSLLLRASAQGDTMAFALLAERYRHGYGVPQRPDIALAWLQLAQRRKFPGADGAATELAGQLENVERTAAGKLSEQLVDNIKGLGRVVAGLGLSEQDPAFPARFTAAVTDHFQRLGEPALAIDRQRRGDGSRPRPAPSRLPRALSWRPRVLMIDDFADAEEIACLLGGASALLADTAGPSAAGGEVEIDQFDGDCAVFAPHLATPVIRAIQRRWAGVLHLETQHFEPMSVLRYRKGQEYAPHVDYFDSAHMAAHRRLGDHGGQRLITGLIYLLVAQSGGATRYPAADLTLEGKPGAAVFHYNATPEGLADPRSLHQELPIEAGEKWLCRNAVRERNLYDELETVL